MNSLARTAGALVALIMLISSPALLAQWPRQMPTAVPAGADGKVNLDAAVPRMPDGKPDLSGVWDVVPCIDCPPGGGGRGRGAAAPPTAPPAAPTAAPGGPTGVAPAAQGRGTGGQGGGPGRATMGNVGGALPDGAPYQPWAAALVKQRMADNSKDNPDAHCLPLGIAQMNAHPFPRKIIQTPTELLLIYEGSGTTVREIFLDGRALPKDPEPWYNGYSVGHWEGDTLVVETTGLMDDGWLDVRGSPITNAGKITERFRRVKYGYIELEETIDDPKVYTKPFTAKLNWRLNPDTQLIEFVCIDKDAAHYVGAVK
ncbi:MAG: hypothetical protein ABI868_03245 [Acidobacteriota bacterium]